MFKRKLKLNKLKNRQENLNKCLSKDNTQIAIQQMKGCSTSLVVKEHKPKPQCNNTSHLLRCL